MPPPPPGRRRISESALLAAVAERERSAIASGALRPIRTEETTVEDAGVRFIVRSVSSLAQKDAESRSVEPASAEQRNPFLPPDADLTIGEITPTHVGVLNKYPVVAHHLLVVTKQFVPQETLLDRDDFLALAACLEEVDGLAFYNAGRAAGASQPHKHLQLVPLPLGAAGWDVPVEVLFDSWAATGNVSRLLRLPFRNAFALLEPTLFEDRPRAVERLQELYEAALTAIGAIAEGAANDEPPHSVPYNLLVTRRWMLAVRRTKERFGTMSVNALGFAGSLFARDAAEMRALREAGPINVLRSVATP